MAHPEKANEMYKKYRESSKGAASRKRAYEKMCAVYGGWWGYRKHLNRRKET
jgi:hypothetical protein